jgi:hypothetical protein
MTAWEEIATYYRALQGNPTDAPYHAMAGDMLTAIDLLRNDAHLAHVSVSVTDGRLAFRAPASSVHAHLGWFKPGTYSAYLSRPDAPVSHAQIVTLGGVVGMVKTMLHKLTHEPQ